MLLSLLLRVDEEATISQFQEQNDTDNETYVKLLEKSSKSAYEFTLLAISATTLNFVQKFVFFFITTVASINLHRRVFSKVAAAAMDFFDLHLSGNILNRFSKDTKMIDEYLSYVMFGCVEVK